jgi:modification methylase
MNENITRHQIVIGAAQNMNAVRDRSVALVVTSPPYPMIEMWDGIFSKQAPETGSAIEALDGNKMFELMHAELNKVWREVERVLMPGGIACVNIGDATRSLNNSFALYPNHSEIINSFRELGMVNLPNIIWRKQTNAPNKFMGAGMLPAGAYVTLEHEWILIFRKEGKREFKSQEEKIKRRESAFFWEERNIWFSDLWDLKGTRQLMQKNASRLRSAAFPYDLAYRLINMYSLKDDLVLDPFLGTGTTILASVTSKRNSIGYEIDPKLYDLVKNNILETSPEFHNEILQNRIQSHREFIGKRQEVKGENALKYMNDNLNLPVMTRQETDISFEAVGEISQTGKDFLAVYQPFKN